VPGHGKTGDRKFVAEQKAWLEILTADVRRRDNEGKIDFKMKPVLVDKLKAVRKWGEWESNQGTQISLAIPEIEQEQQPDATVARGRHQNHSTSRLTLATLPGCHSPSRLNHSTRSPSMRITPGRRLSPVSENSKR